MAELPRYRRDALLPAVTAGAQGVGLQESARASQALSSAMDRVSRAAFQVAEQQAKIEGIEFGAANAPTLEQLRIAKAQGKDLEEMLPGDQFSVFGSQARAAALNLLTTNMEKEARESITALQVGYENNTVSLADMQLGLATIEDSYSSVLADISPAASAKFRASISLAGNAAFLSAAKTEATRTRADQETVARANIDLSIAGVSNVVRAGGTADPVTNEMITVDEYIDGIRSDIISSALLVDDPTLAQTKLDALDKAVEEAKVTTVLASVMTSPAVGLRALQGNGTLPDVEAQSILMGMDDDQRMAVYRELQTARSTKLGLASAEEQAAERARGERVDALVVEITDARVSGDMPAVEDALQRLKTLDAGKYESYADAIYFEGGVDNEDVVADLQLLALGNALTVEDVNEARASGNLKLSTYTSLLTKIDSRRDESYREALKITKSRLGLPDKPMFNADTIDRQAQQDVAFVEEQLILARRRNPEIDPVEFVTPLIQTIAEEKRDAKSRAAARAALAQAKRQFGDNLTADELLTRVQEFNYPNEGLKERLVNGLQLAIDIESRIE